jgi:uncharacterized protein (TIGR02300 family)
MRSAQPHARVIAPSASQNVSADSVSQRWTATACGCSKDGRQVRLYSRCGYDWTRWTNGSIGRPLKQDLDADRSAPKMSNKADMKAQRGTKRACQNPECGARFYDLNQDPITCPICKTAYVVPRTPAPQPARAAPKPFRKPVYVPDETKPEEAAPEAEGDEVVEIEGVAEGGEQEEPDDTILETEEDTSDVAVIIDAPIDDKDEKA